MKWLFLCAWILGCGQSSSESSSCPRGVLFVATDEQTSSAIGVLPLDGSPPAMAFGTELGTDPALATSAGRTFFLARDRDVIYELDPCGRAERQFSAKLPGEADADPWDVAVAADGSLWIARYALSSALVSDPTGAPLGTIDLSAYDADGATTPSVSGVRIVRTPAGERAFFALERLSPVSTGYAALDGATVAVVDTSTRAVVSSVPIAGRNPQAMTSQAVDESGAIYLADAGSWDDAAESNAGIERFDTSTLATSLLFDETALGGSATMVAVGAGCGAAIVADATEVNRTSLVVFSLAAGATVAPVLGPTPGFDLRGLLWTNGELLVGDAQPVAGSGFAVHTFTVGEACALTRGPDLAVPSLPALAFGSLEGT